MSSDESVTEEAQEAIEAEAVDGQETVEEIAEVEQSAGDSGAAEEVGSDEAEAEQSNDSGAGKKKSKADRRFEQLEREGDIAADYLEGLLDIADLDGDIDMDVEADRAMVAIVGADDLDQLVGENGKTLDALQELTRLAVTQQTGERSRLMLDVAGYRAGRRELLTEMGQEACRRAKEEGTSVSLSPMTPYERKIVHDAVADAGLQSESEGSEPNRYVVVVPA